MESLIIVPISQVAAEQRAGRAGRTGQSVSEYTMRISMVPLVISAFP